MAGFGRVQAARYDVVNRSAERGFLGRERPKLLAKAEGETLEIGAGTGANVERMLPEAGFTVAEQAALEPKRTGPFKPFRVGVAA